MLLLFSIIIIFIIIIIIKFYYVTIYFVFDRARLWQGLEVWQISGDGKNKRNVGSPKVDENDDNIFLFIFIYIYIYVYIYIYITTYLIYL